MPIKKVTHGVAFIIYAWGTVEERIELLDFLQKLKKDGHKDLAKILKLFKRVANNGMLKNPEFVKKLCNGPNGGIFEFRANDLRIFWFYDEKRIICTHGRIKKTKKTPTNELEHAKDVQKRYFGELERKNRHGK